MALKAKPYRIVPLSQIILAKLYEQHINDDDKDRHSIDDIRALFSVPVSRNLIISALDLLSKRSRSGEMFIHRRGVKADGSSGYCIASGGIQVVEKSIMGKSDAIAHYLNNGDGVIDDIAGMNPVFYTKQGNENFDDWSPLPVEKGDPQYEDAVKSVEEVVSMVAGDNGLAVHYPDQKDGLLASLKEGLQRFKAAVISKFDVNFLLLRPLRWLVVNFAGNALGEAAKRATQRILDLLAF